MCKNLKTFRKDGILKLPEYWSEVIEQNGTLYIGSNLLSKSKNSQNIYESVKRNNTFSCFLKYQILILCFKAADRQHRDNSFYTVYLQKHQ